jgi:putative phosphoribosyl transferase
MRLFQDRRAAAEELSRLLSYLKGDRPVVLGLANGGVPLAELIARELDAQFDVLIIDRLRAPKNPEHIVGAVDEHGRISMIKSTARWHHLTSQQMVDPAREVFRDLQYRRGKIRRLLPEIEVRGRTVIIVSQGVASGAKMLGAISSVRDRGARKVIVAAPAGSGEAAWQLHEAADTVVIPHRPARFKTVGDFYEDFTPVNDELVLAIVENWVKTRSTPQDTVKTLVMKVPSSAGKLLCCEIDLPPGATRGSGPYPAVIFAHGYESDGRNPRTVPVSRRLAKRGVMGIRADFTGHGRSEGDLRDATPEQMASDLSLIVDSVRVLDEVDNARLGLVGSGSGTLLALELARAQDAIRAVVARGPMCGSEPERAAQVNAATMLVYAERDAAVTGAFRALTRTLASSHKSVEIPGADRLFNDEISREMVTGATVDWLVDHLVPLPVDDEAPSPARADGAPSDGLEAPAP